jgi:bacteriorhodopsin
MESTMVATSIGALVGRSAGQWAWWTVDRMAEQKALSTVVASADLSAPT